jgi:glycerol-3-phosphate acyltransferase PlsX
VRGVALVGHGSSNATAIKNAIRVAAEFANAGTNSLIEREIALTSGDEDSAIDTTPEIQI